MSLGIFGYSGWFVSVAEFITVRFQHEKAREDFPALAAVSVAEFITVRFQPEAAAWKNTNNVSFSS